MRALKLLIILLLIVIIIVFIRSSSKEVTYVVSDLDGQSYLVRDLKDKDKAANMLARLKQNIDQISQHLYDNKDSKYTENKQYIEQLYQKIRGVQISESAVDSVYTSYSVNKGEQLVFCLRSKNMPNKLHDINLVIYVMLHEISHVANPEYGHGDLFKKIFAFIAKVAVSLGMYTPIHFNSDPTEYCGLMINESII